jgi:hypothetical protein
VLLSFGLEYAIRRVQANLETQEINDGTYRLLVGSHVISSFGNYINA